MTYSIVARHPESGAIGIGVQSHFFGVGPVVPWLAPGVGGVATQANANLSFGPLGLELLGAGRSAEEVVAALVASDPGAAERQVAVVDREGRSAAHTGTRCIPAAGHLTGDGYSVQGNLLREPAWPAMARAYEASAAQPFADRLLAALDAAEAAGGDVRGRQSAALVIVAGTAQTARWEGRLLDVRVDDHADPLPELRRLANMSEAYRILDKLEAPVGDDRPLEDRYAAARRLAPDAMEIVFWRGIELATAGDEDAGRAELGIAFAADATWRQALRHVARAGQLGEDEGLVERLLAE